MFDESIKPTIEFLAFLGAALFFGFKILSGFFVYNLSVTLRCKREPVNTPGYDLLIITASLKKGDMSALTLHDIQARVSYGKKHIEVAFEGILRTSYRTDSVSAGRRKLVCWDKLAQSAPLVNLVPNEETSFSSYTRVPATETCLVELVVLGKRAYVGWKVGQWRATEIVPPTAALTRRSTRTRQKTPRR
jgi:hypothetical protein